jgi:hypothetical protein
MSRTRRAEGGSDEKKTLPVLDGIRELAIITALMRHVGGFKQSGIGRELGG